MTYWTVSTIIMGDFNRPDINWGTFSASTTSPNIFCDFIHDHGLSQPIKEPTHNKDNTLDLVLSSIPEQIKEIKVNKVCSPIATDHFPIYFSVADHMHTAPKEIREIHDHSKTD